MPLALEREQSLKRRLETIQRTIGARISEALANPSTQPDNRDAIVSLAAEAEAIVKSPAEYRPLEPWQLDEPQERTLLVTLNVNDAFADAPNNHILTECLIDAWNEDLERAAGSRDPQQWNQAVTLMRRDAGRIRAFVSRAAPAEPAGRNRANATTLLHRASKRIAELAERLPPADSQNLPPFQRSCVHAVAVLNDTVQWLSEETHTTLDWTRSGPDDTATATAIKNIQRRQYDQVIDQPAEFERFLTPAQRHE